MFNKVINKATFLGILAATTLSTSAVNAATIYNVPPNNTFKAYEDYRNITDKTSAQWKLQQMCNTTPKGLRVYKGRYAIAVGTGYNARTGDYVDVIFENGNVVPCIIGDIKDNIDTDASNKQCRHNGSVVEFITNSGMIRQYLHSSGSLGAIEWFEGSINSIKVYSDKDRADMDWQDFVEDFESTETRLVVGKSHCSLGGNDVYLLEYASNTDCNTIAVDKATYDNAIINYSVVRVNEQ